MSGLYIVNQVLDESKEKDEKTLLENLYKILINSPVQISPCIQNYDKLYGECHTEFCKKIQQIIDKTKNSTPLTLNGDKLANGNTVHKMNISCFLNYDLEIICNFVTWIFQRQYSWVDKCGMEENVNADSTPLNQTYEYGVKSILGNFVPWLENHDHLSHNLLLAYRHALKTTLSSPAVRKQVVLSFFCWLKNLSSKCLIVVWKCFVILKEIVFLAITDVWSAIRKDTASKLYLAVDIFDTDMVKSLFMEFVKTCESEESSWQAVEGASRGIDKILGCCKLVQSSTVMSKKKHQESHACIKLGRDTFTSLPQFMKDKLETVLFKLFAHQQLSVREIAGKAFSAFLYKSEYSHFIESFEKVIGYLKQDLTSKNDNSTLKFMNAYEAEGFLNGVLFLIKNIPLAHIIATWIDYWSVFSHYLTHPASTVRQTTSLLFKYILSKHQTSVYFLKLVMQSLCCEWKTDLDKLIHPMSNDTVHKHRRTSATGKKKKTDLTSCWEWREGRLLAYEVMMKYLITNHTFFSLSTHPENLGSGLNRITLNNSITEGQFLSNHKLMKRHSTFEHGHTDRKKLAKSLTLTQFQMSEVFNKKLPDKSRSLIDRAKDEFMEDERASVPFLTEKLPHLELENITDLSLNSIIANAKNSQYEDEEVNEWLTRQNYSSFRLLIKQILLQTVESLEDQRWELRRMSQQLMPYICEVIRCYDYRLLEDVYMVGFGHADSVLYYGGCVCLLNSLKNYIKMKKIVADTLPNKYCESKKVVAEKTIGQFERNMGKYFVTIANTLCECQHKGICNISIQLLLLYHSHVYQKESLINETISSYFAKLYTTANEPENLSLETKALVKQSIDILSDAQSFLQDYCSKTDVVYTIQFLPVIFQSVHMTSTDSLDIHIMLNCTEKILTKLLSAKVEYDGMLLSSSFQHLCRILEKEDLEQHLQLVCNIIILLRDVMKDTFDQTKIKQTIQKTINNTEIVLRSETRSSTQPRTPGYDRTHTGSISEDYLSYSTGSFESLRIVEEESESSTDGEGREREEEEADDDLSSDWDFSSADEAEQDGSTTINILSNFLQQLNEDK